MEAPSSRRPASSVPYGIRMKEPRCSDSPRIESSDVPMAVGSCAAGPPRRQEHQEHTSGLDAVFSDAQQVPESTLAPGADARPRALHTRLAPSMPGTPRKGLLGQRLRRRRSTCGTTVPPSSYDYSSRHCSKTLSLPPKSSGACSRSPSPFPSQGNPDSVCPQLRRPSHALPSGRRSCEMSSNNIPLCVNGHAYRQSCLVPVTVGPRAKPPPPLLRAEGRQEHQEQQELEVHTHDEYWRDMLKRSSTPERSAIHNVLKNSRLQAEMARSRPVSSIGMDWDCWQATSWKALRTSTPPCSLRGRPARQLRKEDFTEIQRPRLISCP
jgi:hypothetical protein